MTKNQMKCNIYVKIVMHMADNERMINYEWPKKYKFTETRRLNAFIETYLQKLSRSLVDVTPSKG